jgi:hypothetical protein
VHGNETSDYTKYGIFPEKLSDNFYSFICNLLDETIGETECITLNIGMWGIIHLKRM